MFCTVKFGDRNIIYQMYLASIYVPYEDLSMQYYPQWYLDLAEFRGGEDITIIKPECPDEAIFLDDYACVFELYTGEPRIRHYYDEYTGTAPQIELVYRFRKALSILYLTHLTHDSNVL